MFNEYIMTMEDVLMGVRELQQNRDYEGLDQWCADYEEGVIQEITLPLVPTRYHDLCLEYLRYEYHKSVDLLELWDEEDFEPYSWFEQC